ncbi:unnamed protein product [Brassica oleracea]
MGSAKESPRRALETLADCSRENAAAEHTNRGKRQHRATAAGLDKQNQERTMMRSLSGRGFVEREKDVGAEPVGDLTHEFKQFKLFRLPSLPHHQPDHCLPPSPRSHRSNHHRRSQTERGNPRPLRKHTGACPQWNQTSTSADDKGARDPPHLQVRRDPKTADEEQIEKETKLVDPSRLRRTENRRGGRERRRRKPFF